MTEIEIRKAVLDALHEIAPEANLESLEADVDFRDQLDLDSMDLLNLVVRIHESLEVEIPEADYGAFDTLDKCVSYLKFKLQPHDGA